MIRPLLLALVVFAPTTAFAQVEAPDTSESSASVPQTDADPTIGASKRPPHPAVRLFRELGAGVLLGTATALAGGVFGLATGLVAELVQGGGGYDFLRISVLAMMAGAAIGVPFGWVMGVRWGGDEHGSYGGAVIGFLVGALLGALAWQLPDVGPGIAVGLTMTGTICGYEASRAATVKGRVAVAPFTARGGGGVLLAARF